jgi:glucose-1-phosphate thymidylyltransferase
MKGIILAGGSGTRLYPLTQVLSKQLLPVYDKPLIYYPFSVLMLADIRDILLISTPVALPAYEAIFGDGSSLGLSVSYAVQEEPRGIAEAVIIGADFVATDEVALILGDNLFYGAGFSDVLADARRNLDGCTLFGYPVTDPQRYGIAEVDSHGRLVSVEEKPTQPKSDRAVTGLYFYDNDVLDIAKNLRPSERGELEITDINSAYLEAGKGRLIDLGRGFAWLDAGTHQSMLDASEYVQLVGQRQGVRIACLEEIALHMKFIERQTCHELGRAMPACSYGRYVMDVARA